MGAVGRKNLVRTAALWRKSHSGRLVIIHSASAGEFEATIPLIDELKKQNILTVATIFSPSGFKIASQSNSPDFVCYLPFDKRQEVREFLSALNPDVFIFCKHDIWPNVVWECKKMNIPIVLLNANLHSKSLRVNPLAVGFNRYLFSQMEGIWTVSDEHFNRLGKILGKTDSLKTLGDTRFDRVVQRALEGAQTLPDIFTVHPVFIAGSVWEQEKFILDSFIEIWYDNPDWKLIWVPHEPQSAEIKSVEKKLKHAGISSIRFSEASDESEYNALIVDKVGILPSLYRYSQIAYVGGGFGKGVHSVIEPAVFSIPVMFGPAYHVSAEAKELISCNGGYSVKGKHDFGALLRLFIENESERTEAGENAGKLVRSKVGCAEIEAKMITDIISKRK